MLYTYEQKDPQKGIKEGLICPSSLKTKIKLYDLCASGSNQTAIYVDHRPGQIKVDRIQYSNPRTPPGCRRTPVC